MVIYGDGGAVQLLLAMLMHGIFAGNAGTLVYTILFYTLYYIITIYISIHYIVLTL